MVSPLAYRDGATSSTSFSRRCRFLTMTGSNEPSRSRGTSMVTGPTPSVVTVLTVVPLRVFALRPRALFSCFARPGCSVVSSSKAVSGTVPVNCLSRPSGPVGSSPRSFARLIISNASSRSAAHARQYSLSAFHEPFPHIRDYSKRQM